MILGRYYKLAWEVLFRIFEDFRLYPRKIIATYVSSR